MITKLGKPFGSEIVKGLHCRITEEVKLHRYAVFGCLEKGEVKLNLIKKFFFWLGETKCHSQGQVNISGELLKMTIS